MGERIGRYIMLMIEKRYPPKCPGLKKRAYSITILIRLCVACLCTNLLLAAAAGAQTFFTEVTEEVGLLVFPGEDARNLAFADYDNDGFQDVFITENRFSPRHIGLFHNTRDGRLVDQTFLIPSDLHLETGSSGAIFGDYDNDGDEDLFLPVWPHNVLLRNDRGRFVRADAGSDLSDSLGTENAIWLDYDRDGYLDLYVSSTAASENYAPRANRLLGNNGDGTFTDQTAAAGLDILVHPESGGSTGGMTAGDFNGDGWPDLYIGVFRHANRLFLSDGQGRFVDATTDETGDVGEAFTLTVGDINNDGQLDIFQGAGGSNDQVRSLMLLNRGTGEFLDITESAGLGLDVLGNNTSGAGFADIDNDGDIDLIIAASRREGVIQPFLMLNDGTGVFTDATALSGLVDFGGYVAFGDYDEDGFVDLLLAREFTALYHNNGNENHWLRVELVGVESNRNGIGARLFATSGDLQQIREILGGVGRQQDERIAHFGLGESTQVDRLEIRWPSGQVDVLRDIPADQKIRIFEGRATFSSARPAQWIHNLPHLAIEGQTLQLNTRVEVDRFDPEGEILSIIADLSDLGGPATASFKEMAAGEYRLSTTWQVDAPRGVLAQIILRIEQSTVFGPYWTRMNQEVAMHPTGDLVLLGEEDLDALSLEGIDGVLAIDPGQRQQVFNGATALSFQVEPEVRTWSIAMDPKQPIGLAGFHSLAFALHPGDARGRPVDQFSVKLNNSGPVNLPRVHVDMDADTWQIVNIPLEEFTLDGPVTTIIFTGNLKGTFYLDDLRLIADEPPTAVGESREGRQPTSFDLAQNYPNPFNSGTLIRFALPQSQDIELSVYNLAGQKVATLVQGQRATGSYAIHWDGRDDQERALASGLYLYRLRAGEQTSTRKLLLLQ